MAGELDIEDVFWELVEGMMATIDVEASDLIRRATQGIFDPILVGRRIKAARILAGYDRVSEFVVAMRTITDVGVSRPTIYNVEKGIQPPSLDFMLALLLVTSPPGGWSFFADAVRPEHREAWDNLFGEKA